MLNSPIAFAITTALALLTALPAEAGGARQRTVRSAAPAGGSACSTTAADAYTACGYDQQDNYWIALGKCQNVSNNAAQKKCVSDAQAELSDGRAECTAERAARKTLCAQIGEAPYDPSFKPSNFVDPTDIGGSVAPNPFLPLVSGRTLVYRDATTGESTRVTVTGVVTAISGVPCVVVRDTVTVNGEVTEDTVDWMAQDVAGNVWYCGEATAEYENGLPVNTDGSFQAGVDGAKPGLLMKAASAVGDVYRQEFDLGNAEDAAKVIDLAGSANVPATSCARTCLVTEETTALEPDALEHKYYQAGIGVILTTVPGTSERDELVQIID